MTLVPWENLVGIAIRVYFVQRGLKRTVCLIRRGLTRMISSQVAIDYEHEHRFEPDAADDDAAQC